MIVKLDRFNRPRVAADVSFSKHDSSLQIKNFIHDQLFGDMYPYVAVIVSVIGILLLLQLASTALLTFLVWYLLVTGDAMPI